MSEEIRDVLELRRTAKETKRYVVLMRVLGLLVIILTAITAVAYAISYFYDKFGSFTVRIDKYDMVRQGLALSETPDYEIANARLDADIVNDMTNISGEDLPPNIDMINGPHNGESYIAYTFYLINSGDDTITYTGEMTVENVTKGVDEAIRIAVYKGHLIPADTCRFKYCKISSECHRPHSIDKRCVLTRRQCQAFSAKILYRLYITVGRHYYRVRLLYGA